jgi:hypothetical protein
MALLDRLLGGLTNVSGSLLLGTKGQTGGAGEALGGLLSGFAQARWMTFSPILD